jgi:hypothetical protein
MFSICQSFKVSSEDCVRMMTAKDPFSQLKARFHQREGLLVVALGLERECEKFKVEKRTSHLDCSRI